MALTIFKILGEALKLSTKNFSLILPILLLSSLSSTILFFFSNLSLTPPSVDLVTKSVSSTSVDPNTPEHALLASSILKDTKQILRIEAIVIVVYFILYSLFSFATIHVFSSAYTGELLTPKNLFSRLVRKLKGPMITRLYVLLLNLGYIFLLVSIISFIVLYLDLGTKVSIAVGTVLSLVGLHVYLYLSMVWSLSVVVSVVEEESSCYGLEAISKAVGVMKERRRQGGVLSLIMFVMMGVVLGINYGINYCSLHFKGAGASTMSQLGFGFVTTVVSMAMGLFQWAIVMVFYGDCKESKGEKGMMKNQAMEVGFMYKVIAQEDV